MEKKLCSDSVYLEPLSKKHIQSYLDAFSEIVRVPLRVGSIASEQEYLVQRIAQKAPFFFVIKDRETNKLVGAIEIRDPGHRSQLYCWLNETWWGSGAFLNALQLAAQNYFSHTNEAIISARVNCSNKRSLHALEKVGFVSQGIVPGPVEKQYVLIFSKER